MLRPSRYLHMSHFQQYVTVVYCFATSSLVQITSTATTGADSIKHGGGHVPLPTFTNGCTRDHRQWRNSKQETDQSVLTVTKALTKTTNCTCTATKVGGGGTTNKISGALRRTCPLPHFQIRSGATAHNYTELGVTRPIFLIFSASVKYLACNSVHSNIQGVCGCHSCRP